MALAPSLQQNNASAQDAKASVQEMSTQVNEALKAYATAIGENILRLNMHQSRLMKP